MFFAPLKSVKTLELAYICDADHYSADSSSADPQEGSADKSSHPLLPTAAPSEPEHQPASTCGSGSDAVIGDQALEARFAADLRTLARTPAFDELLG